MFVSVTNCIGKQNPTYDESVPWSEPGHSKHNNNKEVGLAVRSECRFSYLPWGYRCTSWSWKLVKAIGAIWGYCIDGWWLKIDGIKQAESCKFNWAPLRKIIRTKDKKLRECRAQRHSAKTMLQGYQVSGPLSDRQRQKGTLEVITIAFSPKSMLWWATKHYIISSQYSNKAKICFMLDIFFFWACITNNEHSMTHKYCLKLMISLPSWTVIVSLDPLMFMFSSYRL